MQLQQGDVWIELVNTIPNNAKTIRKSILAWGEVTGHKHQLEDTNIDVKECNGRFYISIKKPTDLNHEEHKTITLPPGNYEFGQVREYDYLKDMERQVID